MSYAIQVATSINSPCVFVFAHFQMKYSNRHWLPIKHQLIFNLSFLSPMHRGKHKTKLWHQISHRQSRRCTDGSGGDGCGGGPSGGGDTGKIPGRGVWAQPELPGLRGWAAAVPEQAEEHPDTPEWPEPTRGPGLPDRPLQGHNRLKGNPTAALFKPKALSNNRLHVHSKKKSILWW